MKYYKDKVLVVGYLAGVQGDLEGRLDVFEGNFIIKEPKEERKKTIENHVRIMKLTQTFLHELWDDYNKLLKEHNEQRQV